MKRWIAIFLAAVCTVTLTACASKRPNTDEVRQAIEEGNVTLEDAVSKGWVTQEWADGYIEENSVPSSNKMEAGAFGDFTTTTLSGKEFTRDQMAEVTLFAFVDPSNPDAPAFYQALADGYEEVKKNGAEILVCTKAETGNELFEHAPFPVILYSDSLQAATEHHKEMIEGMPNTAFWCMNNSFASAWFSSIQAEELGDDAASFVQMQSEMSNESSSENGGMVVMG